MFHSLREGIQGVTAINSAKERNSWKQNLFSDAVPHVRQLLAHCWHTVYNSRQKAISSAIYLSFLNIIKNSPTKVPESKFVPACTMKVHRWSRGTVPLILNLSTRWRCVVKFMFTLFFLQARTHFPLNMRMDVFEKRESLAPDNPGLSSLWPSLYSLSYPDFLNSAVLLSYLFGHAWGWQLTVQYFCNHYSVQAGIRLHRKTRHIKLYKEV